MTVLPVRSMRTASSGASISPALPTLAKLVPSTRNAEFSTGVLPSPTMSRAPSNNVTLSLPESWLSSISSEQATTRPARAAVNSLWSAWFGRCMRTSFDRVLIEHPNLDVAKPHRTRAVLECDGASDKSIVCGVDGLSAVQCDDKPWSPGP